MKRILQALDHAETKPVVGQDDMKKFLQVVTEGASPHKVALPVQMAMQHYQQPQVQLPTGKSPIKTSVRKFFKEVEGEHSEKLAEKKQLLRQYSQAIAERVLMREFKERPDSEDQYVYKGDNPTVKGALTKAKTQAPGADDDFEALIINSDRVATNLEKAQAQITRQQEREDELTDILGAAEQRFRDLNAKVAAGEIDDQDVAAAQAAQEIEKDVDHAKSQVGQTTDRQEKTSKDKAVDKIKDPVVNKPSEKEKKLDQKPVVKKVNTKDVGSAINKMVKTPVTQPAVTPAPVSQPTPVSQTAPVDASSNPGFPFDPFAHTANTIRHMQTPDNPNALPEKPVKDPNQRNLNLKRPKVPAGLQSVGRQSKASTAPVSKKQQAADIAKAAMAKAASKGTRYDPALGFGNFDNIFGSHSTVQENHASEEPAVVDQPQVVQQPVDSQQQKRTEIDANTLTIRKGLKDHLPKVDIHIDGVGITVYRSQMYAFIQTLGHIKNPKIAYERRDTILNNPNEWFSWVDSPPTRKWIGHFDNWWKTEQRKAKQARLQATGTHELDLQQNESKELVLNYLATKEGFPNWLEAKKILDESDFNNLLQRASKLIKQLKENEIPGQSIGFKPGPGSPGIQNNAPDGGHLGLGEKMSPKKTLKNSNPCWTGYHPVGTKKKGGRTVPNCVPTSKK